MRNFVISLRRFRTRQTAEKLLQHFSDVVKEVLTLSTGQISPLAMVVDNGKNFAKAASQYVGQENVVRCFAHSLQLVINTAIDYHPWGALLTAVRKAVIKIRSVPCLRAHFKLEEMDLVEANDTRWSSEFSMQRLLKLETVLKVPVSEDLLKAHPETKVFSLLPTWAALRAYDVIFIEFSRLTIIVQSDAVPNISEIPS